MTAAAAPIIATTRGRVRGTDLGTHLRFLGIPYAEPPIGERRFLAPVPRAPWDGVRDAVTHGPTPQRPPNDPNSLIPEPSVPGTDTLSVNVWTPSPDAALPVLVYVHGGGYVEGSTASPWYDGRTFARDGVVTVTLSYRLGFDGFAHIPGAPDNRGLRDVAMALRWVRGEIAAFGGDPARVTIAGQSAGAGIVLSLLSSPIADGLFHRAWAMSPALTDIPPSVARGRSMRVAALAGVSWDLAGLRQVPERRIRQLQAAAVAPRGVRGRLAQVRGMLSDGPPWGPTVDGEVLPTDTLAGLRAGHGANVPLVVGALDDEFTFGLRAARIPLAAVPKHLALRVLGVRRDAATAWLARTSPKRGTAATVGRMIGDLVFRRTVLRVLDARADAPTWAYRFSWPSPVLGYACHCLDVPFLFDVLDDASVARLLGDERPQTLASAVHGAAAAFVRGDDPGWPAWSEAPGTTRVFDLEARTETDGYADIRPLLA